MKDSNLHRSVRSRASYPLNEQATVKLEDPVGFEPTFVRVRTPLRYPFSRRVLRNFAARGRWLVFTPLSQRSILSQNLTVTVYRGIALLRPRLWSGSLNRQRDEPTVESHHTVYKFGAPRGTRTPTAFRPSGSKPDASAIPPAGH